MILVVDNYDSFTWNLVQLLGMLGQDPVVVRNDERSVDSFLGDDARPHRVLISPGPCTPAEAGISVPLIQTLGALRIPILGVCLGHQAIGEAFGGRTVRAFKVMHGKVDPITHTGTGIFEGLPNPLSVTRYHSLLTSSSELPEALEAVAWSVDETGAKEIQAIRHRALPIWGVQFHPESLFSEGGAGLLRNFLSLDPG
jgi:anthranilate synthase/aminodeoxychorismate synthase-like glutamine amidotransferase